MSVVVSENFRLRVTDKTGSIYYDARGSEDIDEVVAAIIAVAPVTLLDMAYDDTSLEHQGGGFWTAEVTYAKPDLKKNQKDEQERDDVAFDFEIGGASIRRTQAITTRNRYAATGLTAKDHKGAIGVTREGIEGVEVEIPTFGFSISKSYDPGSIDWTFIQKLYRKNKSINSDAVTITTDDGVTMTFAAGELKYDGATISKKSADKWRFKFSFSASENATAIAAGNGITIATKKGWDYVWFEYSEAVVAAGIARPPIAAHVEQVYAETTLNDLL